MRSPCPRLHIAVAVMINTTACSENLGHTAVGRAATATCRLELHVGPEIDVRDGSFRSRGQNPTGVWKRCQGKRLSYIFIELENCRRKRVLVLMTKQYSVARSSATADGPRDAHSVKILSTVETSCTTNPQQIEVLELEGYS